MSAARRPLVDFHEHREDSTTGVDGIVAAFSSNLLPDRDFERFVNEAAKCANEPISGLKYRSPDAGQTYRLGTSSVEGVWQSARPRTVNDITLCTNLDRNRLHMLRGQCEAWGGPMSVAVYVPTILLQTAENRKAVASLKDELSQLHADMESKGACTLDVVLISELRSKEQAWAYPYNMNRNQAITRARTRLVLLLDADFLPSTGTRKSLLKPSAWQRALRATHDDKHVLVLPAFETKQALPLEEGMRVAERAAAGAKPELVKTFKAGDVVQFAPFFFKGHGATNYSKWLQARETYRVFPEVGYEPFIIMSRLHVPPFDERFRGYGWDKITHIFHLNQTGFKMMVYPDGWVVHRPHEPSTAHSKTFTGPAYTKKQRGNAELKKLARMAQTMMDSVTNGTYPARGVTTLAGCGPTDLLAEQVVEQERLKPMSRRRQPAAPERGDPSKV